jgi:hypothetical protein
MCSTRRSLFAATLACLTLTAQPGGAAVLYSQLDNGVGPDAAVASQDFEAALDAFDSQGADDFAIPSGTSWHITELFVDGLLTSGGTVAVTSVDVFVYADSAGSPGALFTSDDATSAADSGGDLTIAVDLTLPSGVWWLSVQANLDFLPDSSQWFWLRREPATDGQGHWRNPGDGFNTGATDWTAFPDLSFITTESSDLLFEIRGTVVPAPSTLALIGIGAAGWVGLARRRRTRSA